MKTMASFKRINVVTAALAVYLILNANALSKNNIYFLLSVRSSRSVRRCIYYIFCTLGSEMCDGLTMLIIVCVSNVTFQNLL